MGLREQRLLTLSILRQGSGPTLHHDRRQARPPPPGELPDEVTHRASLLMQIFSRFVRHSIGALRVL